MIKKTHAEYVAELKEKRPDIEILGEYMGSKAKILHKCSCDNIWMISPNKILKGHNCYNCMYTKLGNILRTPLDKIDSYIKNLGYEIMDIKNYKNRKSSIILKDSFGYYYKTSIDSLSICKPLLIYKSNPYSIQNIKLWCKLNNKPFELISDIYEHAEAQLEWKCLKDGCGETFGSNWHHISQNRGCPFCSGKQVGLSNCLAKKKPELIKEWHPNKNGDLTAECVTFSSAKKVWWICEKGHEWEAIIANRNIGSGCPFCNESKGEKRMSQYLDSNNFIKIYDIEYNQLENKHGKYYIPQKEFEGLVGFGGGNLSYDFYLPNYDLLIEFQGRQHERYIKGLHKSKKDFEKQQEHDRYKKEYANNQNIKLLEIWYWDFDNIETILQQVIAKNLLPIPIECNEAV